jgi:hypothetical protein
MEWRLFNMKGKNFHEGIVLSNNVNCLKKSLSKVRVKVRKRERCIKKRVVSLVDNRSRWMHIAKFYDTLFL